MTTLNNEHLLYGFNHACNSAKLTLGAEGKLAVLEKQMGMLTYTKDGVSVVKSIFFYEDVNSTAEERAIIKQKQVGANAAKQVAVKTLTEAGDNTTTALVLAQALLNKGLKAKASTVELRNGIELAFKDVVKELKKLSNVVTKEDLVNIATISANGDKEIANMLIKAYSEVGDGGIVDIVKADSPTTTFKSIKGMKLEKGYMSPFMVTNNESLVFDEQDVTVIVCETPFGTTNIAPLEQLIGQIKTPILVIAEDFSEDVVNSCVYTHLNKIRSLCLVKTPDFGQNRKDLLQDLAVYTGAEVYIPGVSENFVVGTAKKVIVSKDTTFVIQDELNEASQKKLLSLKEQETDDEEFLKKRIANFENGVSTIYVGGITDAERDEKYDRYDDAKCAIKSALEEGYVAGGGSTFYHISNKLKAPKKLKSGEKVGYNVLLDSLKEPFLQILRNGEVKWNWWNRLNNYGDLYDIKERRITTAEKSGIIDSTKSLRVALENAKSISSLLINTKIITTL